MEIVGDEVVEGDEVVTAELVVPQGESGVSLRSSRVQINIIDDDSRLCISLANDKTRESSLRCLALHAKTCLALMKVLKCMCND